jgi:hypothetical protein
LKYKFIFAQNTNTMGQYYHPLVLADKSNAVKGHLYSHEFSNGLKLMEHSYIGNYFVEAAERLLAFGSWRGKRLVWAGDYGDLKLYDKCNYANNSKSEVVNYHSKMDDYHFILNHTKRLFVDKRKAPMSKSGWSDGMTVHPLPLLTADGNGRGGGDYHKDNHHVGTWAKHRISIANEVPKGYKELIPNFEMD